jgi:hypothetical protein
VIDVRISKDCFPHSSADLSLGCECASADVPLAFPEIPPRKSLCGVRADSPLALPTPCLRYSDLERGGRYLSLARGMGEGGLIPHRYQKPQALYIVLCPKLMLYPIVHSKSPLRYLLLVLQPYTYFKFDTTCATIWWLQPFWMSASSRLPRRGVFKLHTRRGFQPCLETRKLS